MKHIFISYSHKDKEYAHKLREELQKAGFEVWIDDSIVYGVEWLKIIEKKLDECKAFIILMSKNSYASDMVQNEVTRAREKKKNIFPLLLDGDNWLVFQAKQYVNVTDQSLPTEKFYDDLAHAINHPDEPDVESEAYKLFSQAIQLNMHGNADRALQLFRQVKEIDPYFPNIDLEIRNIMNEIKKGQVGTDGRVSIESIMPKPALDGTVTTGRTKPEQTRRLSPALAIAILAFVLVVSYSAIVPFVKRYIAGLTPTPTFTFTPTLTPTPTFTFTATITPVPAISTLNAQYPDLSPLINEKYAPYKVLVSGNASNAMGLYLYLIVDDGTKKWIQKPLGLIPENNFSFSGYCFLGDAPDSPFALNKTYIIYAVISADGSYKEYADFTSQIPITTSPKLNLVRNNPPTP